MCNARGNCVPFAPIREKHSVFARSEAARQSHTRRGCRVATLLAMTASSRLFLATFLVANIFVPISSTIGQGLQKEDALSTAKVLKSVREKMEREEQRLLTIKKHQTEISQAIESLTSELKELNEKKHEASTAVELLEAEGTKFSEKIAISKRDLAERHNGLKARVVALYKIRKRGASIDYLFGASSATDLLKRAHYLERISMAERRYLNNLEMVVKTLEQDQRELENLRQKRALHLQKILAFEKRLSEKHIEQEKLLAEGKEKESQIENSLNKLKNSAENLETVVASLMGSGEVPLAVEETDIESDAIKHETPVPLSKRVTSSSVEPSIVLSPFDGLGLARLRGKLIFPVPGQIVQKFGRQKHDEFSDMLFVKGLEIAAPVGARVKVVASGKIVLNQVLPGYGNIIIVDHGQRYYTLYARLASSLKAAGDVVERGDILAILGQPDFRGRNFYFELRIKGKATNPVEFFANPPPPASS